VRRNPLFIVFLCLSFAPLAHAAESDTWDLRTNSNLPSGSQGLTVVEKTSDGIHVKTSTDGFVSWSTPLVHPADVLTLRIYSPDAVQMELLWHIKKSEVQAQQLIDIPASNGFQDVSIALTDSADWDWTSDQIALGIPQGSNLVVQSMIWTGYSVPEKISNAWQSFWTFDSFRAYTINFLWGPLITTNPIGLLHLFDHLPPTAWSIDRYIYGLLLVSAIMGAVFFVFNRKKGVKVIGIVFFGTFACLWILFDLRMSAEVVSYAIHDVQTFVLPDMVNKTFRTHASFYAEAEQLLPTLKTYDRFLVLEPSSSPVYSNLRYMAFPSIAMTPDNDVTGVKLFAVFDRPDIHVNTQGRLVDGNGQILSGTGKIIDQFNDQTYLFATP
jgi:hypothetical protein